MLKTLQFNRKKSSRSLKIFLDKRKNVQKNQTTLVSKIIQNVKNNGDKAVIYYEKKFSKIKTRSNKLFFTSKEISKISKNTDIKIKKSIDLAFDRIKKFHSKQKFSSFTFTDKYKNVLSYKYSSLDKVGVYVPGGTASYPSTVLMNCIPAIVAGVKNIYLTTPSLDSKINPAVVYAAKKCGVKKIYKTGGAHTIAALAYGTKKFEKVDKIVGPGNAFVASAKKEVFGDVGIDMVAGPSEVSIVADKFADPDLVAADLIAQAEHDTNAQSILITNDKNLIQKVNFSLKKQLIKLPKKNIASQSLKKFGLAILANSKKNILEAINIIAPEHLELYTSMNKELIRGVKNAGSIFIGRFSPEAIGDYMAGPNHVLPTSGSARFSSGLSVNDFLKRHSLIKITKTGIERLGSYVINLAKHENLDGHANSVRMRLKKGKLIG
tara:strand:- start:188 stop:1495 length:1308 start_codon:yes stop_codon:yes gene_type:complete